MSKIKERVHTDIKDAMKNKDVFKRDALRLLASAMKQIEVDERKELTDSDMIKIIQKQIKQREDSSTQYKDGGREDLYQKEIAESDLYKSYLPTQLDDTQLEEKLREIIIRVGALTQKDMGKVMGVATKELEGIADGKRINLITKKF